MIYLAAPYSHASEEIRDARMEVTNRWVAAHPWTPYFSPLTYSQRVRLFTKKDFNWLEFDWQYFQLCDGMHILALPGWDTSHGVSLERTWSNHRNMDNPHIYDEHQVQNILMAHEVWDDSLMPAFFPHSR